MEPISLDRLEMHQQKMWKIRASVRGKAIDMVKRQLRDSYMARAVSYAFASARAQLERYGDVIPFCVFPVAARESLEVVDYEGLASHEVRDALQRVLVAHRPPFHVFLYDATIDQDFWRENTLAGHGRAAYREDDRRSWTGDVLMGTVMDEERGRLVVLMQPYRQTSGAYTFGSIERCAPLRAHPDASELRCARTTGDFSDGVQLAWSPAAALMIA